MNQEALYKISYGMYIICSKNKGKINGQIANTLFQITSEPAIVAVSINKLNLTHELISASKMFTASVLTKDAPMTLIGQFGFKSGRDTDKFAGVKYSNMQLGIPVLQDSTMAYIECEVVDQIDCATHTVFMGKVVNADVTQKAEPMTYAYYHEVKKGSSPKTAPTYIKQEENKGEKVEKYKCEVCGYIYDPKVGDIDSGIKPGTSFDQLPQAWVCPICGADKSQFVKEA